ncbi:FAD-dependent monooxygenase [Streptosporangium amethystogenes]|uniref:FAD-dependent monooxygenase n=1 Tax=Streptosporangium amethystogenes TaxID=2002 RepID=UPI0004C9ED1A|nr:FAD-dependent monooxygenase [Streptosporangium amethystogenes]
MADPVVVAGAGPVGLITALGLVHHGLPVVVLEEDERLSPDTRAGSLLTRTLEILHRYGALPPVLRAALRVDEIGEFDRSTNLPKFRVLMDALATDTRFPFIANIPQHHLEPVLRDELERRAPGALRMGHRVTGFEQDSAGVAVHAETASGPRTVRGSYLLGCDGGRSAIRGTLGVSVEGRTLDERYALVDLEADLDIATPRDYPYLAYFSDPREWVVVVRLPHCWRFVYPLTPDAPDPDGAELYQRALCFLGDVGPTRLVDTNVYRVHHRIASHWRERRVFLLGDAAHLITPMWALGLNTGALDISNLAWRLAWVSRGWAGDRLLDEYEREQLPVASLGSGRMAEAARAGMAHRDDGVRSIQDGGWGTAQTRTLLGVRLDVDGSGDWGMVKTGDTPAPVLLGDRVPDLPLFGPAGQAYLHDLCADSFVALHFTDARRAPRIPPADTPALRRYVVSRWDTSPGSELRDRLLVDPGERVRRRFGVPDDTLVLLRPDGHIAAIRPFDPREDKDLAADLYTTVTDRPPR